MRYIKYYMYIIYIFIYNGWIKIVCVSVLQTA